MCVRLFDDIVKFEDVATIDAMNVSTNTMVHNKCVNLLQNDICVNGCDAQLRGRDTFVDFDVP